MHRLKAIFWSEIMLVTAGLFPMITMAGSQPQVQPQVSAGHYLAIASDCVACHTQPGGKPFAGGLPMHLPMGDIYTTNITPDPDTGIGRYSLKDFENALRKGIRADGSPLYPAMPYPSYSKLSDEDVASLYDYFLHEVQPVRQENRKPNFSWPLTMRWPLHLWNALFLESAPYRPTPEKSVEWNRGAYLVQGAAHCGTCHTPRGLAMQEKAYDELDVGYLAGAQLGGWDAFNITPDINSGIGSWHQNDTALYLKTGNVPSKAQAAGQMAEAITHSFSRLKDSDLNAIANYISSISPVEGEQERPRSSAGTSREDYRLIRTSAWLGTKNSAGAQLYAANCASCHGKDGSGTQDGYYPSMFHNSAVGARNPNNLIQVVLNGAEVENGQQHYFMPAFAEELSDTEVAILVNYLSQQYGYEQSDVSTRQISLLRKLQVTK